MPKPTVYLDTNIFSAYWYDGADVAVAAQRFHTSQWWNLERKHFSVYVSPSTIAGLRTGSFRRQADCLKMALGLPRLPMTQATRDILDVLLGTRLLPDTKLGDALQIAVCVAHRVDYLLTWNYAHLANPMAQQRLETICRGLKLRAPLLVSPETIPQVRFGQSVRRRGSP
jgi:hypothetical protein